MKWFPLVGCALLLAIGVNSNAPDPVAAMVAAAKDGEVVTLPDGLIILYQPIRLHDRRGVTIQGGASTVLDYRGPETNGVVDLQQCDRCVVKNLAISVRAEGVTSAIRIGNHPKVASPTTTACRIEDVDIPWDGGVILPKYGLFIDSSKRNTNNDRHTFTRVRITGAEVAACKIVGTQVHQLRFDRCDFVNYAEIENAVGILTDDSGYFSWTEGAMYGWDCDFRVRGRGTNIVIRDSNSEQSRQFLDVRFGGANAVSVTGGRWEGRPAPGRDCIYVLSQGPVLVSGMEISSNTETPPTIRAEFYHLGPGNPMTGGFAVFANGFKWKTRDDNAPNIYRPKTWFGFQSANVAHIDQGPGKSIQREVIEKLTD